MLEDIVIVDNGSQKKYRLEELRELTSFPVSLVRVLKNTSYSRANDGLIEPGTRGDPESPLRWVCKSTRILAWELRLFLQSSGAFE